jgi:hypothetical protein
MHANHAVQLQRDMDGSVIPMRMLRSVPAFDKGERRLEQGEIWLAV